MSGLISNGTYVLGDPNTRELYVQSPLTTGMSGTSAYIGVDTEKLPGNETVLYSGAEGAYEASASVSVPVSEPMSNFERIRIVTTYNGWNSSGSRPQAITEIDTSIGTQTTTYGLCVCKGSQGTINYVSCKYDITYSDNTFNVIRPDKVSIDTSGTLTHTSAISIGPVAVYGINRKEV